LKDHLIDTLGEINVVAGRAVLDNTDAVDRLLYEFDTLHHV